MNEINDLRKSLEAHSNKDFEMHERFLNKLESIEDKFDGKLDGIQKTISEINTTLELQHQSLEIHIKRSDALEKRIEQEASRFRPLEDDLLKREAKKVSLKYTVYIIGGIVSIIATIYGMLK